MLPSQWALQRERLPVKTPATNASNLEPTPYDHVNQIDTRDATRHLRRMTRPSEAVVLFRWLDQLDPTQACTPGMQP